MAMEMPPCAYMDSRLGNSARVVLAFLYMHINRKRGDMFVYWPIRRIAKHIHGRIPASIRRDLSTLQKAGYIEKATIPVKGATREGWTVLVPEGVHSAPGYTVHPGSSGTQGGTACTLERVHSAPPINTEVNQEEKTEIDSRPKGQPLAANNALLFPDEPPAAAKPPSSREQWIQHQWKNFTGLHRQVQDRLIATGAAKRHSNFPFRPAYKRMLGTLYREKYTGDELFGAWVEMAKNAEDQQSLKYFRPSTCFVAKNINRSLEDRVNDDAQDPQEIAEVADPG